MRRVLLLGGFAVLCGRLAAAAEPPTARRPATRPPARPTSGAAPPIDPPPTPPRIPGLESAPTPARDPLPPAGDRTGGPTVDFGVPTPRELQQGQTFRSGDPGLESRGEASQSPRLPAPGATVRVPF